jgi:hypothetical protein
MITLLSTIFGVISGVLPNLVKILERRQDYKYEIELTKIKLEAAARGLDIQQSIADSQAIVEEGKSLRDHDLYLNGNKFLDTLRASVRPLLTYFFFFMFCGIKIAAATLMFKEGYNSLEVLQAVWDIYTVAIFGSVIGFWFGSRAMTKLMDVQIKNPTNFIPKSTNTRRKS